MPLNPSLLHDRRPDQPCCTTTTDAAPKYKATDEKLYKPEPGPLTSFDLQNIAHRVRVHSASPDPSQQEACRLILNGLDYLDAALKRAALAKIGEVHQEAFNTADIRS